ncbi:hypothetical protein H2204_004889 [Knufia peltigerae]|uniref:USP domain-containing protein n=1 Tax=Knufia peltigerae TaxID=1002370 RepID=A0AA38Y738_9EURO|nr:hypothetical protein H2204_004889 [Knufia peltigerae]
MSSSTSDSSTRNRSDSTEGSGLPQHEHKRPRLSESKPDETQVMSDLQQTEKSSLAPSASVIDENNLAVEGSPHRTPPLPPRPAVVATAMSPTSRVTIQTRPLSSQSVTKPSQSIADATKPNVPPSNQSTSPAHGTGMDGAQDHDLSSNAEPSNTEANTLEQPDASSIPSSPSKSPEIEIAEVEDYDRDPTQTRWTTRIGASARATVPKPMLPHYIQRTFPYAGDAPGSARRAVLEIANRFQHGGAQDGELFSKVKNWMVDFVDTCTEIPQRFFEEDHDFWQCLPGLIECLLRRTSGPPPQARVEDLIEYFVAYARVTKLIMEYDARNIQGLSPDLDARDLKDFIVKSMPYYQPLIWMLQPEGIPFYDALRGTMGFEIAQLLVPVLDRICGREVALVRSVSNLITAATPFLSKKPDLVKCFIQLLTVTGYAMKPLASAAATTEPMFKPSSFTEIDYIRVTIADVMLKADHVIQQAIVKQAPWLNLDSAPKIIGQLMPIVGVIAVEVPKIGQDIVATAGVGFADSDLTDLPSTMPQAWKFKTLRKFITHGRMELRVFGVENMSNDLVQVYKERISNQPPPPTSDPLVRFLVKFIQQNQIIDYIIGVDSHPQLIHRSHNVVGFLCVSGTYTDATTDVIWKTIVESQDPRTVHEVFNLLSNCHVYDLHALCYICRKLADYPFQRFDTHVLQFTVGLLDKIRSCNEATPQQPTDPTIRHLLVRLLREACLDENLSLEQATVIRKDFSRHLGTSLTLGGILDASTITVDDVELSHLIKESTESLRSHKEYSSGDVLVLTVLVPMLRQSLSEVIAKFDLIELLVADIVHLTNVFQQKLQENVSVAFFEVAYDVRATLLYSLMLLAPTMFSKPSIESLWTSFFTAKQLPVAVRARAWDTLINVMRRRQVSEQNPVLDLIVSEHVQRLGPQDYDERVLEFLKISVSYTIRHSNYAMPDAEDVVVIPGIDRMWRVMLEAPPNTVENQATEFIIQQYLDHQLITRRSREAIDATHSSLVDRCVQQVMASAAKLKSYSDGSTSGEDEPMAIIASDQEIRAEELRFDRSLLFLRKFLEGMKSRPRYSPTPSQQPQGLPEFLLKKGDEIEVSIQVYGSRYVIPEKQKVAFGSENTGNDLWKYISEASGFTDFTIYHWGQGIELSGCDKTLAELDASQALFMVHKIANSSEKAPTRTTRASSPVDYKIMHHFDDLYDLLDSDERLSGEVYGFLSLFPAQSELIRVIRSREKDPAELLPPKKPFKLLYCARALLACIEDESFSSEPNTLFLTYSIQTILAVLPKLELSDAKNPLQMSIAHWLIQALLLAFRAKVPAETSQDYIQDRQGFAAQIYRLLLFTLEGASTISNEVAPAAMVKMILEAFTEACLHDDRVWEHVDGSKKFEELLALAFIAERRADVRHSLLEVVVGLTGAAGTKIHLKINNPRAARSRFPASVIEACLSHLWAALVETLPHICEYPEQCAEISEAVLVILRRIGKSITIGSIRHHFVQWSAMLLEHDHRETVGQPTRDHVVGSLTKLLYECCKLLKSNELLPPSYLLMEKLIDRLLLPPLSVDGALSETPPVIPVLDSTVREGLYNLLLALSQGPQDKATILAKLQDAAHLERDFFEPIYVHERQSLRTEVGYAGLRNLSNTCYLNSLFTQLFMNVQIREFFLDTDKFSDPKKKLVKELAKVFAHMQNSYEKSIDPSLAVEAITTYEGEQIDVSIQMDVDEFFNLLFDRLESQIDHRARDLFKSIYGGQLVQQIKSKECEHISERLEPFSAVQVEIKGKARLEDSLRAYVEGEVLQGENKYSCTSCGRHVDAVKRSCLKDVPDNLIFNLKRFDYDILTGMRTKVNDEFQFPDVLDIAPYTLASLSDEGVEEQDQFQLTGVIVHSGTADTGHYYSFIRQRPSSKPVEESWVQFNDTDVTVFDPSQMRDNCFGGNAEAGFYHLPKYYSAYMLFYQRTSSIERFQEQYRQHDAINPVRLPLPYNMEHHIAQQNELFLRSYCIQDSTHAQFVLRLLERMVSGQKCSDYHAIETGTLEMALDYVYQISSRWKDHPGVEESLKLAGQCAEKCCTCAKVVAEWFASPRVLEDVIARSPYQLVRKAFASLFNLVYSHLHALKSTMDATEDERDQLAANYSRWLQSAIGQLAKSWDMVTKIGRCWPEYFGVLLALQRLGDDVVVLLFDEEFLEKCIDIISIHVINSDFPISKRLKTRYSAYLAAREKNRPFSHGLLVRFLVNLVLRADLHNIPGGDYRLTNKKIGLTPSELEVLGVSKMPPNLDWLLRLIAGRQNPTAANDLVISLAQDPGLAGALSEILHTGLNDRLIHIAITFLNPIVTFCEQCESEPRIIDLVQSALDSIATVGVEYARDYFEFLEAILKVENQSLDAEAGFLEEEVLKTLPRWAPTFLLCPIDGQSHIRHGTMELLKRLVFTPLQEPEYEDPRFHRQLRTLVQELARDAQGYIHTQFLTSRSRAGSALFPGQVHQIIDVVENCLVYFDLETAQDEEQVASIQTTLAALRAKAEAEAEAETLSTEWQENSSEMAEMSTEDFEDLQSP